MKTHKLRHLDTDEFTYGFSALKVARVFTADSLVWPALKNIQALVAFL